MSKSLFLVFTVLLFADVAEAETVLDHIAPPAQACHVRWLFARGSETVKNEKGQNETIFKQRNGCSATIIGKRDVLISASCIPDVEKSGAYTAQLICDGGKKIMNFRNLPQAFPKHDKAKIAVNDIAILQTKDEIGIEPAQIPADQKEWDAIFKVKKCVWFGYGNDVVAEDAKPRAIRAYVVPEELARSFSNIGEVPGDKSKMLVLSQEKILPGDTGGGMLCQNDKGVWYAMNVTSYLGEQSIKVGAKKLVWPDGKEFTTDTPYISALTGTPIAAAWLRETMNPKDPNDPKNVFGPAFPEVPQPRVGSAPKARRDIAKSPHE